MCELWKGFQEGPNSIEQSWQSNKFRWIILQIIISSSFCCPTPTLHSIHSEHPLAFIWYIEHGIPRCTKMAHWSISVTQGLLKVKLFKTFEKIVTLLCLFNTFWTPTRFHLVYWTWNSPVYELNAHCYISVIWGLSKVKLSFIWKVYKFSLKLGFCFGFEKTGILIYDEFKK